MNLHNYKEPPENFRRLYVLQNLLFNFEIQT